MYNIKKGLSGCNHDVGLFIKFFYNRRKVSELNFYFFVFKEAYYNSTRAVING